MDAIKDKAVGWAVEIRNGLVSSINAGTNSHQWRPCDQANLHVLQQQLAEVDDIIDQLRPPQQRSTSV